MICKRSHDCIEYGERDWVNGRSNCHPLYWVSVKELSFLSLTFKFVSFRVTFDRMLSLKEIDSVCRSQVRETNLNRTPASTVGDDETRSANNRYKITSYSSECLCWKQDTPEIIDGSCITEQIQYVSRVLCCIHRIKLSQLNAQL
jgi:hypothetical protein